MLGVYSNGKNKKKMIKSMSKQNENAPPKQSKEANQRSTMKEKKDTMMS
jgi:hypothetical protein